MREHVQAQDETRFSRIFATTVAAAVWDAPLKLHTVCHFGVATLPFRRKAACKNRRRALLTPPTVAHLSRELPFIYGIRISPAWHCICCVCRKTERFRDPRRCHVKTHPHAHVRTRASGRDNGSSLPAMQLP